MYTIKEIKRISPEGRNRLDNIVDFIMSGRLLSDVIITNNLIELIECERLDAAAIAIEKSDF